MTTKHSNKLKIAVLTTYKKLGKHIYKTCQAHGMSSTTFYEWIKADKWFEEAVDEINLFCKNQVENVIYESILKGKATTKDAFKWLQHHYPDEYSEKPKVKAIININNSFSGMSNDEIEKKIAEMKSELNDLDT